MVACGYLAVDFAFEVGDAFSDGRCFDAFGGDWGEVAFFEFVEVSA